ncbi:unnamed protein product [Malus baccata var. baccata]
MATSSNFNMLSMINIEKLNGTNFKAWKQKVEMHLGMLEFDITFKLPQPSALTDDSTALQRDNFAKWERANQMSLLIMQNAMEGHIRGGISVCDLAKDFVARIEEKYKRSDKAETGVYLSELINTRHDGVGSVREHLLKLVNLSNKLNAMDIGITDQFLKIKTEVVNLVHVKGKGKMVSNYKNPNYKGSKPTTQKPGSIFPKKPFKTSSVSVKNDGPSHAGLKLNKFHFKKCHHCHPTEHLRKDCPAFKDWLIRKGISKPKGDK